MTDVRSTIKDAAYIGIGFGVLAFQKAQVQRQELQKRIEANLSGAKGGFEKLGDDVQDRIKLVEERLDKALDQVAERLPEQAKELFSKARTAGKDARTQVRQLAKSATPKAKSAAA